MTFLLSTMRVSILSWQDGLKLGLGVSFVMSVV